MSDEVKEVRGFKFIELESGRQASWWDFVREAERRTTDTRRAFRRALLLSNDDWDLKGIERRLEDWERWIQEMRKAIERKRGIRSQEERIARLRNVTGRTPEESAAFLRKADELERELRRD